MTLFASDSQYRERAAIWRMFTLMPLYATLAQGRIWRWFAINIPMDLGTGDTFTSDIDILGRFHDFRTKEWVYDAWEVKVALLGNDGSARSIKRGKLKRTLTQLEAYREFGIPRVSLLDVFICQSGYFATKRTSQIVMDSVEDKIKSLWGRFGYQLLPFEHAEDGGDDVGLLAVQPTANPLQTSINLIRPPSTIATDPFLKLAGTLNDFHESQPGENKSNRQIIFCRACRTLQLIAMRDTNLCPACSADLIIQS